MEQKARNITSLICSVISLLIMTAVVNIWYGLILGVIVYGYVQYQTDPEVIAQRKARAEKKHAQFLEWEAEHKKQEAILLEIKRQEDAIIRNAYLIEKGKLLARTEQE